MGFSLSRCPKKERPFATVSNNNKKKKSKSDKKKTKRKRTFPRMDSSHHRTEPTTGNSNRHHHRLDLNVNDDAPPVQSPKPHQSSVASSPRKQRRYTRPPIPNFSVSPIVTSDADDNESHCSITEKPPQERALDSGAYPPAPGMPTFDYGRSSLPVVPNPPTTLDNRSRSTQRSVSLLGEEQEQPNVVVFDNGGGVSKAEGVRVTPHLGTKVPSDVVGPEHKKDDLSLQQPKKISSNNEKELLQQEVIDEASIILAVDQIFETIEEKQSLTVNGFCSLMKVRLGRTDIPKSMKRIIRKRLVHWYQKQQQQPTPSSSSPSTDGKQEQQVNRSADCQEERKAASEENVMVRRQVHVVSSRAGGNNRETSLDDDPVKTTADRTIESFDQTRVVNSAVQSDAAAVSSSTTKEPTPKMVVDTQVSTTMKVGPKRKQSIEITNPNDVSTTETTIPPSRDMKTKLTGTSSRKATEIIDTTMPSDNEDKPLNGSSNLINSISEVKNGSRVPLEEPAVKASTGRRKRAPPQATKKAVTRKKPRKGLCALCRNCSCQLAACDTSSEPRQLLSRHSAVSIERALLKNLERREKAIEAQEEKCEDIRKELRKTRRNAKKKKLESLEEKKKARSRFLADPQDFNEEYGNSTAMMEMDVCTAQRKLIGASMPVKQATFSQLGWGSTRTTSDDSPARVSSCVEPLQTIPEEMEEEEIARGSSPNAPNDNGESSLQRVKRGDTLREREVSYSPRRLQLSNACDSKQQVSNVEDDAASMWKSAIGKAACFGLGDTGLASRDFQESDTTPFSSSWDAFFSESIAQDLDGIDQLLCLFENSEVQEHETGEDGVLPITKDMLSQRALATSNTFQQAVELDDSKLAAVQTVFPAWQENIMFAFAQKDGEEVRGALENLRNIRLRVAEKKRRIVEACEQQERALDVFEAVLSERQATLSKTLPVEEGDRPTGTITAR